MARLTFSEVYGLAPDLPSFIDGKYALQKGQKFNLRTFIDEYASSLDIADIDGQEKEINKKVNVKLSNLEDDNFLVIDYELSLAEMADVYESLKDCFNS